MRRSKITGSCYVGAGQFTVANGASYSPPSIVSGCVMTVIRANGVSVDSGIDDLQPMPGGGIGLSTMRQPGLK